MISGPNSPRSGARVPTNLSFGSANPEAGFPLVKSMTSSAKQTETSHRDGRLLVNLRVLGDLNSNHRFVVEVVFRAIVQRYRRLDVGHRSYFASS